MRAFKITLMERTCPDWGATAGDPDL